MIEIFVFFLISISFSYFAKKINFLPNFSGEKHQAYLDEKRIPLIGGILLLIISSYLFYENNFIFLVGSLFIYLIGLLSDAKILSSPKIRIILQTIIVILITYFLNLNITSTRIDFLDKIFEIKFLSFIFSVFCLIVLLNGSNFIDGLNGLLLGYLIIVILILAKLDLLNYFEFENKTLLILIFSLLILLILNYLNFFYLGDGGSYLSGIILGYILISIYNYNIYISPYFIILLLWYPCFENLFSIIRKSNLNRSPVVADNKHLHQLFFYFIKVKFKFSNLISNNLTSILINCYNFLIMLISTNNISSTKFQILLIFINLIVYLFIYKILFNFKFKKK